MKGIVLAGGSGTRLYPLTKGVVKQLLPIYDKPMIYYPISVLMIAGIREILIISTAEDIDRFKILLGDGSKLGITFQYKVQASPDGLAQAFILGEKFIGKDDVCLVLGDNVFYGGGFSKMLYDAMGNVKNTSKAVIFAYYVKNPEHYGVVDFDDEGKVLNIIEKPKVAKSNYAVVGLYFYPNSVVEIAKGIKPSKRGELEITAINQEYLKRDSLNIELMGRGFAWLDTGTHESLLEASNFVQTIEHRQGLKIACLEEISYYKGYINKKQLLSLAKALHKNQYGQYLMSLIKE